MHFGVVVEIYENIGETAAFDVFAGVTRIASADWRPSRQYLIR